MASVHPADLLKVVQDKFSRGPQGMIPAGLPMNFLLGRPFLDFITNTDILDARRHLLYSFKTYPTGGQTKLSFFDQNIGAATNNEGKSVAHRAIRPLAALELERAA